ncbi:unnamed protein product [Bursaphelenchus okinawaensis]|uniref:Uncharacterized protein n=1 Tax=Bursaphelenchus okinawaensis TaxID=465554 RepID=A0A811KFJ1_9BILA|nr:unnamed protein product [Bursaphelenchus okinawaensis]CAG9102862.1 unnamed protein product [Bursaphelenchus okinawaensis]
MCISHLGQIIYGSIAVVILASFCTAIVLDDWVEYRGDRFGYTTECSKIDSDYCGIWKVVTEKIRGYVLVLLGLTVAIKVGAVIYNFTTFFCICCRSFFLLPLVALGLASVLTAGPLVYLTHSDFMQAQRTFSPEDTEYGKSFYIAGGGLILAVINLIVSVATLRST